MIESKKIGTKFEKDIITLLKELEFSDVDGARDDFIFGGVQVDAVAGWEDVLLVFECTTKKNLGKKDLSEKISSFRGKMSLIRSGLLVDSTYKHYKKIWFILATKNIEIRKVDIDLAIGDKSKKIYILYDDFLGYYANQYRFTKPFAKYNLLGELGIKPINTDPITTPAFRALVNGEIVYTFLMNPRDLLEVAFVARREKGAEQYYQRIINESRLIKIATYVNNGGIFPNSIILAFREDLPVTFQQQKIIGKENEKGLEFGLLSFPRDFRSCWVIDGQHRLYAFANIPSQVDFKMPITAFEKLPIQNQRKYFLDINRNQKPVDSDLLWDLSGDFLDSFDGIISNSVKFLNTHIKSPLHGFIYYPSCKKSTIKSKLKISAFCIALKKNRIAEPLTLQKISNPLYLSIPEKHYIKIAWSLISYLLISKEIFPKNWNLASNNGFILSNGGMAVMIALYERILSRIAEKNGKPPNEDDFRKYLSPLTEILEIVDQKIQKQLRIRATSEGGKSELVNELVLLIRKEVGDIRFGGDIETKTNDKEFLGLENLLKELIGKYYSDQENSNWLASLVDESTFKKSLKLYEKNNGKIDMVRVHWGLTMGECFTLLNNNFQKVANIFINEEEYSFPNQQHFKFAGEFIGQMRAKISAHATGAKPKKSDVEMLKLYMDRIQSCLQKELTSPLSEESIEALDQPIEE